MKVLLVLPVLALAGLAVTAHAASPAPARSVVTVAPAPGDTDFRHTQLAAPAALPVLEQALPQPPLERTTVVPAGIAPAARPAAVPAHTCTSAGKVAPACAPA